MRKIIIAMVLIAGMSLLSCIALAGEGAYSKDEYVFNRLLGERAEVYEKYVRALKKGKEELKANGEIELKTKNDILDARAKKDRLEMRIITIALRHGWDVPALSARSANKRFDIEARELEKVFGIAKVLVKSELRKDAGWLTADLELPAQRVSIK